MSNQFEVYKCSVCGAVIEVLRGGAGELVCCEQPMKNMIPGSIDAAQEKHVPVLEKAANGCIVKVGSAPHVMEEKHWIEWIELVKKDGTRCIKFLKPGDAPEASFGCAVEEVASVREYCNLHGLWKA